MTQFGDLAFYEIAQKWLFDAICLMLLKVTCHIVHFMLELAMRYPSHLYNNWSTPSGVLSPTFLS